MAQRCGSEADPLAVAPDAAGATLIAVDIAIATDGDRAARADGYSAARTDAAGAIGAADTAIGTRFGHAEGHAEQADGERDGALGLARRKSRHGPFLSRVNRGLCAESGAMPRQPGFRCLKFEPGDRSAGPSYVADQ